MAKRKKFVPPPIDPQQTWLFNSGQSQICRECATSICHHRCACHPALSTDKCPKCGGEFWQIMSTIDWEGTEEQYKLAHERLAPLGLDYIAPGRLPVPAGSKAILTFGTVGEGFTFGRGYIVAPAGRNVTVTSMVGEAAFLSVFDEEPQAVLTPK